MLPHDFPNWQVVYQYFRTWRDDGTLERVNDTLRIQLRLRDGREADPSAAILDSQTVKGTEMGADGPAPKTGRAASEGHLRGFEGGPPRGHAGKKTTGIKRHALVDVNGWLLALKITPANVQDPAGARGSRAAWIYPQSQGTLPATDKGVGRRDI